MSDINFDPSFYRIKQSPRIMASDPQFLTGKAQELSAFLDKFDVCLILEHIVAMPYFSN